MRRFDVRWCSIAIFSCSGVISFRSSSTSPSAADAGADETGGNGDLRQAGERALLARARLAAESLEAALVRMRPREIRGIQQRIELLLLHQADKKIAERFAARNEVGACLAQLVTAR